MRSLLGDLKLRLLLAVTLRLMRRGQRRVPRVEELMGGESFVFQVQTAAGRGGYFEVKDKQVQLRFGLHPAPDFCQIWRDGHAAFRVLTSGDATELLRAFEDGLYLMRGDFLRAIWLNEVMMLCRAQPPAVRPVAPAPRWAKMP